MWTVAEERPASIWAATAAARLTGIAKPSMTPDCNWNPEVAAVSRPITCPAVLTSGPPESPGCRYALVRISPVSCSEVPAAWSLALIDSSRPVTLPVAAARHVPSQARRSSGPTTTPDAPSRDAP